MRFCVILFGYNFLHCISVCVTAPGLSANEDFHSSCLDAQDYRGCVFVQRCLKAKDIVGCIESLKVKAEDTDGIPAAQEDLDFLGKRQNKRNDSQ